MTVDLAEIAERAKKLGIPDDPERERQLDEAQARLDQSLRDLKDAIAHLKSFR